MQSWQFALKIAASVGVLAGLAALLPTVANTVAARAGLNPEARFGFYVGLVATALLGTALAAVLI